MAARRQLGGVFVWSLEGVILGALTYGLQQSLAALNVLPVRVAHEWVLAVVVLSSAVQLITQLALAAWHKQDALVSGDISDAVLNSFALAGAEGGATSLSDTGAAALRSKPIELGAGWIPQLLAE